MCKYYNDVCLIMVCRIEETRSLPRAMYYLCSHSSRYEKCSSLFCLLIIFALFHIRNFLYYENLLRGTTKNTQITANLKVHSLKWSYRKLNPRPPHPTPTMNTFPNRGCIVLSVPSFNKKCILRNGKDQPYLLVKYFNYFIFGFNIQC